jgi:transcriptional regulator of acetoin/glycerol metabolism
VTAFAQSERAQALDYSGGNKSQAAASLGIARATLYRKLKELGIWERDAAAPA